MELEKYSLGIGDRFGMEGRAQLRALQKAQAMGADIVPVWNKSNREHTLIGTTPEDARKEADEAVSACNWKKPYYVDADHIGIKTVGKFLSSSNFFTIDVADFIGKEAGKSEVGSFLKAMARFKGNLRIPGIAAPFEITEHSLESIGSKYLLAIQEAGKVYRHIAERKGAGTFVVEVSADETNTPQTPAELFFILGAISLEGIPIQTIAPKFTGSFLKGVDYVGEKDRFAKEFEHDLAVVAFAIEVFKLPKNLKLSIHSGSDKFSLYPVISEVLGKKGAGVHLKTAGTTWLEEVIGLAASGGEALKTAKEIYGQALQRYDELAQPYLSVIHIDPKNLPPASLVNSWTSAEFVDALRHDQRNPRFNSQFRQLIHIAFKVAAGMGDRFTGLLAECRKTIESNVTMNLFERHLLPLFLGPKTRGD